MGATIVTSKPDEVCSYLSACFECGMTTTKAKGYYSNTEKSVVYIILNRFQLGKMQDIVHNVDPTAYISISEVADVYTSNQN